MNFTRKLTLLDVAKYFHLDIEYDSELPSCIHGLLQPGDNPRFILINANQPVFEQRFTIAHEIGHYVIHHNRPRREHAKWLLNRKWPFRLLDGMRRYIRRGMTIFFNQEWEADLWAIGLLVSIGDADTLKPYLERHPNKAFWALLIAFFILPKKLFRLFLFAVKRLLSLVCPV